MGNIINTMTPEEEKKAIAEIQADVEAHPELYEADDKRFNWEDLGVGGYAALNTAGFGIPDVILKAADSQVYKDIQKARARNKAADIAGTIAGAFIPTEGALIGAAAKGAKLGAKGLSAAKAMKAAEVAGKVGKGLDVASDIAKGTKEVSGFLPNVGKGALIAGEQILPTAVTGQATPQEMLLSLGLGGAAGGVSHGLGTVVKNMPEKIEDAKKWADKTIMKRANINDKVMRAQKAFMGNDISKYYADLADFAEERSLHRGPELDKLRKEVRETWASLGKNFDKDKNFVLDVDKIVKADDVAQAINRDINTMSKIDNIVTKTNDTVGFGNKREYLNEILYNDKFDIEDKKIARQIINQLEEHAEDLSGLGVGKAKHDWRMMKPFEAADILDDMKVAKGGLAGGSDTVFKLGLAGAVGGTGISGLNDVKNDPSDPKAWVKLLGAGVLGGSLSGAARESLGVALAKTVRGMPTEQVAKIIDKVVSGKVPKIVAENLPKGVERAIASNIVREEPSETIAKEILEQGTYRPGTLSNVELQSKQPVSVNRFFKGVSPEYSGWGEDALDNKVIQTPTEPSEKNVTEAKQYSDAYYNKIEKAMKQDWIQNYNDKMDYADYLNQVAAETNNFDPKEMSYLLFKNQTQREKFLKSLDVYNTIKNLDVSKLYNDNFIEKMLNPATVKQAKFDQNRLAEVIATLTSKEGNVPTKTQIDQISNDIKTIAKLTATSDEKKQLLMDKLQYKYGLDYNNLTQLGLV